MVDHAVFARYVSECLARLGDEPYLGRHPLAPLLTDQRANRPGEALQRVLLQAIDRLKPVPGQPTAGGQDRRHQYLRLRYEEGLLLQQVAQRVGVSQRQASRDHQRAVHALAQLLWTEYTRAHAADLTADAAPPGSRLAESERGSLATEVARAGAGAPVSTDLSDVVDGVLATMERLARSHGVRIESSIPATVSAVLVDRTLLRHALFSLLSYAIEVERAAHVAVGANDLPQAVELTLLVRHRRGRPPDRPPADVEPDRGLSAARAVIEAQAGRIEVVRRPDGSVALLLVLPARKQQRVMVIDDNPDIVALFRRYVRGTGYQLVHAGTLQNALALAEEFRPQAITLDLMMPSQDGWEVLQGLRAAPATRDAKVVVCSVMPERALAQSLGAADFLPKPVTRGALLAALDRCLG